MALTIEDGSQVTGADSYISVADAQAYLDARAKTVTVTEALLYQAMGELNAQSWKGGIVSSDQALDWPRHSVRDCQGRTIEIDAVPSAIGYAQAMLAYNINAGYDPTAISTKKIIGETVDVISLRYSDKGGSTTSYSIASMPEVNNLLKCYLSSTGYLGRA